MVFDQKIMKYAQIISNLQPFLDPIGPPYVSVRYESCSAPIQKSGNYGGPKNKTNSLIA